MSSSGLGALSQDYIGDLELDKGLAPVVLLMIVGIALTKVVNICETKFSSWRVGKSPDEVGVLSRHEFSIFLRSLK